MAGLAVNAACIDKPEKRNSILRKFFLYPYLLYRDRDPARPDRILPEHHCQFPVGVAVINGLS